MTIKYRKNNICSGYGSFIADITTENLDKMLGTPHYHKGRSIECRSYLGGNDLKTFQKSFNIRRIYVGNLPEEIKDEQLFRVFSQYADLTRAYVANERDSKGVTFGFIVLKSEESADKVLSLNGIEIEGQRIRVRTVNACKQEESGDGFGIYIKKMGVKSDKNVFVEEQKDSKISKGVAKRFGGKTRRGDLKGKKKNYLNKLDKESRRFDPYRSLRPQNTQGFSLKSHKPRKRRDQGVKRGKIRLCRLRLPGVDSCCDQKNIRLNMKTDHRIDVCILTTRNGGHSIQKFQYPWFG